MDLNFESSSVLGKNRSNVLPLPFGIIKNSFLHFVDKPEEDNDTDDMLMLPAHSRVRSVSCPPFRSSHSRENDTTTYRRRDERINSSSVVVSTCCDECDIISEERSLGENRNNTGTSKGSPPPSCQTTIDGDCGSSFLSDLELDPATTAVMVRNIPTRFTSVSFLRVLEESGFCDTFDFFYLPMDFRTGKNMGYCFINFLTPNLAHMFGNIFHGTRLGVTTSNKVLHVSVSKRQGLRENVALFRGSDLLSSFSLPYFKPVVQMWGELMPLCENLFHLIMMMH